MRMRAVLILAGLAILVCVSLLLDAEYLRRGLGYVAENPLALTAAFGAYTGAFALRALAWRPLISRPIPRLRLLSLLLAALFLNHVAPGKAGDFARMYGISKRGVSGGEAAAGVVLARLADLVGLLVVLTGAWALTGGAQWGPVVAPAAAIAAMALAIWGLARLRMTLKLGPLTKPVAKLQAALRETRPRSLAAAFLWAAPAWVLEAGVVIFVARALGLELSLSGAVVATCFAVLFQIVPLTPGGLGTYEAGMVFALVALGVPAEPAFAAAVASHALKFLYSFAAAPFAAYEGLAATRTRKTSHPKEVDNREISVEV